VLLHPGGSIEFVAPQKDLDLADIVEALILM
jgi:hypothetical protein